jgi:hypothetical protein
MIDFGGVGWKEAVDNFRRNAREMRKLDNECFGGFPFMPHKDDANADVVKAEAEIIGFNSDGEEVKLRFSAKSSFQLSINVEIDGMAFTIPLSSLQKVVGILESVNR